VPQRGPHRRHLRGQGVACLRLGIGGEVLVADNGSTDGSRDIAVAEGARVVPVPQRGYGAALLGGIEAARGRYVIMGDADQSYDFTNLGPFIDRLCAATSFMGNRLRAASSLAMPWLHRYVGNPALSGILNLFFRSGWRRPLRLRLPQGQLSASRPHDAGDGVRRNGRQGVPAKQKMSSADDPLSRWRDRPPHLCSFRDGWRHRAFCR
jgi:glycosyltransferase involved in cell wall biosynthesis